MQDQFISLYITSLNKDAICKAYIGYTKLAIN